MFLLRTGPRKKGIMQRVAVRAAVKEGRGAVCQGPQGPGGLMS